MHQHEELSARLSQSRHRQGVTVPLLDLSIQSFPHRFAVPDEVELSTLPPSPTQRSIGYLWSQMFSPPLKRDTGLEHLSLAEFMAVKRATEAFEFAVESDLREGWWSSLLHPDLLTAEEACSWRGYLKDLFRDATVIEIGPGDGVAPHAHISKKVGAATYVGIDLQERVRAHGGIVGDALEFFSNLPPGSIDVVMAFGVFNEPLSLQYPAHRPPSFRFPAREPQYATRAHAEHEYVRRLFKAIHTALADDGVVFGDGLHSRGFERDVEHYIIQTGFTSDAAGYDALSVLDKESFLIRDPFFFKKQ